MLQIQVIFLFAAFGILSNTLVKGCSLVCENGGTCVDNNGVEECDCSGSWYGRKCVQHSGCLEAKKECNLPRGCLALPRYRYNNATDQCEGYTHFTNYACNANTNCHVFEADCEETCDVCGEFQPCENGGTCSVSNYVYTCACADCYSGVDCQTLVDCGGLSDPTNGEVLVNGTTCPNSATYTCDTGYEEDTGDSERTCQNDGTWSGDALTCKKRDCGTISPPPLHTQITYSPDTAYGGVATHVCVPGYKLENPNVSTRTCDISGDGVTVAWTHPKPKCVPCGKKKCPKRRRR